MRLRLRSMTAALTLGVTLTVAAACAAGAYLYSRHHLQSLLEHERGMALAQGELMRAALEHEMVENDRTLIAELIDAFGREPRIARVTLVDRVGRVRYASGPPGAPEDFRIDSPTCQACHRLPGSQRGSSQVIETRDGSIFRTVIPFRNTEACQTCHDPKHRINGVMILDTDFGTIRADVEHDLTWMVIVTGAIALVAIAAIAWVVRLAVLKRLHRFETTARRIAEGDLERRVPADGSDTISWLAAEFNTMADSMSGLVREVRHQTERLETVINSIDDGIVVLDTRRKVIAANDAFLRRSGRAREAAVGCFCKDGAPGACTAADCPTVACLHSGERQVRICERHTPDGAVRWEEVHASPVRDAGGTLTQIVEVWRDISDRRAAEARLAESHRLASVGMLASGFSHELNTPLATVLMCVEGILREAQAPAGEGWPRVADTATIARDQVLRCRGITQHFLRMSRGQPSASDVIDLAAVLSTTVRLLAPTARAHHVRIEAAGAGAGVHLRGDEAELQHAVMNLILNAVQACPPGGTVTVTAWSGERVRVRVRDTGCGIAPEHRKRIFEPFFSMRAGGTGLGLFLALNFVRRSGGDLTVESTPGAGSTFEISLPAPVETVEYKTA